MNAHSAAAPRRLRILVVEDQEDTRDLIVEGLRTTGEHTIASATNAAEGLRRLRDDDYDLIVTDIGLFGVSGLEMLDQAQREGLLAEAAIVVCSANAWLETQALERGACWIPKPVDFEKLCAVVGVVRARVATVEGQPRDESGVALATASSSRR